MENILNPQTLRPIISDFENLRDFYKALIQYRKDTEPRFSILQATKGLRKVSPTLVSLILQGKRQLTLDRLDEFAKLLKLTTLEKNFVRNSIEQKTYVPQTLIQKAQKSRKEVSTHILSDWINVYVKDCFEIPSVQSKPELVFEQLAHLASPSRIQKSIQFLLREGHLRKTLEGHIVTETPLTVTDPQVPSQKIRNFHKGALSIAKAAIDNHSPSERYANTLILSMNEEKYQEMVQMIQDFAERLKDFASESQGPRLYQVLVNLSPTGGKFQ